MVYEIKKSNEDFRVCEIINLNISTTQTKYSLFCLSKSGLSTFAAISHLSHKFNLSESDIGVAGLKDEEGITFQYITIKNFNKTEHYEFSEKETWLRVDKIGYSHAKISVGDNAGNSFNIVLRELSKDARTYLNSVNNNTIQVPNYYDSQRFGLPNSPAMTHLIGKEYKSRNFSKCLEYAKKAGVISNEDITPENLESAVPMRERAFWLSSFESYLWNKNLSYVLESNGAKMQAISIAGSAYYSFDKIRPFHSTIPNQLEINKWRVQKNKIIKITSKRDSFIYTKIKTKLTGDDSCSLEFTLPTGCYATMLVKTLFSSFFSISQGDTTPQYKQTAI